MISDLRGTAVDTIVRWRTRPVAFVQENFNVERIEPWQLEALEAFPHVNRLAFKASKGVGKTALEAWLIWNFLATRPNCRINFTSITGDNLASGLSPELAKWGARSPYLSATYEVTANQIVNRAHPRTWWAKARTWPKSADASQLQSAMAGLHEDYAMAVLDESSEMPQAIMATVEAVLGTGREVKVVQAGNPSRLDGPLHRACVQDRHLWKVISVSGDPDDPKRSRLVREDWARQQIQSYGRDNAWVRVNVLGEFPEASLDALLGIEEVEAAMHRHLRRDAYEWAQKRIGIDVARFGDDRTVLFPRQGLAAFKPVVLRHARDSAVSVDIATRVLAAKAKWGSELEAFDGTGGWAAGAIDVMRAQGFSPIDVQFHGPAIDPRYKNRRAEMWMSLADWVKRGGALPLMDELVAELTTPTYSFSGGKFVLEEKDQIKARLGRSPDLADALALTFALPDMPAAIAGLARQGVGRALCDGDPYAEARR